MGCLSERLSANVESESSHLNGGRVGSGGGFAHARNRTNAPSHRECQSAGEARGGELRRSIALGVCRCRRLWIWTRNRRDARRDDVARFSI